MNRASAFDLAAIAKYLVPWLVMLLVAVANGAIRDFTYGRHLQELTAHQVSTAVGIVLLGVVIWAFQEVAAPASGREALAIGLFWATLTVAFEFLFFHFVGRHSWAELFANYNVLKGRVWIFVVIWMAVAPYLFFHYRGQP